MPFRFDTEGNKEEFLFLSLCRCFTRRPGRAVVSVDGLTQVSVEFGAIALFRLVSAAYFGIARRPFFTIGHTRPRNEDARTGATLLSVVAVNGVALISPPVLVPIQHARPISSTRFQLNSVDFG